VDNFDYDRLGSVIANAMKGDGGGSYRGAFTGGSAKEFVERIQQYSDALKKQTSPLSRITAALTQHNEELSKTAKGLDEEYKKRLAEAKRTGTPEEVQALKTNKKQVDTQIALAGTINSLGSFKKSATDVSNAFGRIITSAGSFLQGSGNEIGAVGNVIGSLANQIPIVGGAIGSIVGILTKELEKTVEGFRNSNRAGALFAGGMTDLRNNANRAGLTLEQFSKVLLEKRQDLAYFGEGVGRAAERLSGAVAAGGAGMQKRLLNLGYSFEEQAGLFAETMRDLRQSGGPLTLSNAEIAQQTEKYATNLRILTAITGEDGKKRMDEARRMANQLAFQQKLAGMDAKQRQEIIAAMAGMSEMERRNFMDRAVLGTVINKEGAVAEAMFPALSRATKGYADAMAAGNLTAEEQRRIQAENTGAVKEQLLANQSLGQALYASKDGLMSGLNTVFGSELDFRNRATEDAIKDSAKRAEDQKNTTDALTSATNNLITTVQDFRVSFEREIMDLLPQFASTLSSIINGAREFVSAMGGIVQLIKEIAGGLVGALVGGLLGTVVGAVLGGMAGGPVGAMVGAALGGKLGAGAGFLIGGGATATYSPPARAAGGPVNPSSTYLVGERGPELFRPSAAGAIVPNNEISSAAGPISGELVNVMREQLEQLRQLVTKSDETTAAMSDLRSIQQQLLNNSY
jgi:uncharacterized protein YukE